MKTGTKVIIALVILGALSAGGYYYFTSEPEGTLATDPAAVLADISGETDEYREAKMIGQQLAATLSKLQGVKMDIEFFKSEEFKSLRNRSYTVIPPEEVGRTNPFAPINPNATVEIRPSEEEPNTENLSSEPSSENKEETTSVPLE